MKKYLFIDTWNGEGYSESTAFVRSFESHTLAEIYAKKLADDNSGDLGIVQKVRKLKECHSISYACDFEQEDSGGIAFLPLPKKMVGVIVIPNVNDFLVVETEGEWKEKIEYVWQNSDRVGEGEGVYNVCHECMEGGYDWIMFEKSDLTPVYDLED